MSALFNFDEVILRTGTSSMKWDLTEALFGEKDMIPMWVADMDFKAPPAAIEAMQKRAMHGVFGYTFRSSSYLEAAVNWQEKRHQWKIKPEWIVGSPGVVTALSVLIELLSDPGDHVMIQAPVYHPFYRIITSHRRRVTDNQLLLTDSGRYELDLEEMERQIIADKVKLLVLCHPHNPVGRVWNENELRAIGQLCVKHGVFVLSDEIHGDIIFKGHRHIPFASLSEEIAKLTVTCTAPSKTFNIAGLHSSSTIIEDEKLRERYMTSLQTYSISMENCFAQVAVEACYRHGEPWLEELLIYLEQNADALMEFVAQRLPQIKMYKPEGTYLAWLDCRAVSENPEQLKELMFHKAKVAFNEGSMFGKEGAGFLRVNFGTPRSLLMEGMERFARALEQ